MLRWGAKFAWSGSRLKPNGKFRFETFRRNDVVGDARRRFHGHRVGATEADCRGSPALERPPELTCMAQYLIRPAEPDNSMTQHTPLHLRRFWRIMKDAPTWFGGTPSRLLRLFLICLGTVNGLAAADREDVVLRDVVEQDRGYELAAGPNVEGVVFLRQVYSREESWPEPVLEAFRSVDWIDAASVRVRWDKSGTEGSRIRLARVSTGYWPRCGSTTKRIQVPGGRCTSGVMGGEHVPGWFEEAGVKRYDTLDPRRPRGKLSYRPIRIPTPFDNPEFLRQLRQVYVAMRERYGDEPLVDRLSRDVVGWAVGRDFSSAGRDAATSGIQQRNGSSRG